MSSEREDHVNMARLAERAERYDEMASYMRDVAKLNVEFTLEERNLFTVAYKNIVGAHRASWRIISSIEEKEKNTNNEAKVALVKAYREKIETDISNVCIEIITIVDDYLIPNAESSESKMYCYKLKGDYYRYLAESSTGDARENAATTAREAYSLATDIAEAELPPAHPARLGLVLNFSVFYYEILNSPDRACHLAKQGFDDAITGFDSLSEESYKDSTFIMQLLRDNLTLWTTDENQVDKLEESEAGDTTEV